MTSLLVPPRERTRRAVAAGLIVVTVLSWLYLVLLSARMSDMGSPFAMPMTASWTWSDALLMWTMWSVMMAGMMLPAASPMVSAYARTVRSGRPGTHGSTPLFVVGYLATWSGFALVATAAQWGLHQAALVNAMGTSTSRWLGGLLLLTAAAYQFTGAKDACLTQCRTPLSFLLNQWRCGRRGALIMGIRHGAVCIGCCWALMAVLFVLGVMNLWWIAVVAAVVLVEKVAPGDWIRRPLGGALAVWGSLLLLGLAA